MSDELAKDIALHITFPLNEVHGMRERNQTGHEIIFFKMFLL